MSGLPVPSLTFLVASASMEQEIACLLKLNPHMEFVVYTLDFRCAASLPDLFQRYGIGETEVIQLSVSKLTSKNTFEAQPAPWIVSGKA
jgi:precorrin-6Y C5,15-methyltransferase (decarboxylating)